MAETSVAEPIQVSATVQPIADAGRSTRDRTRRIRRWRLGQAAIAAALLLAGATPASADLRLCNVTASKVGVTLGYRDPQGWVTEGWWDLKPKACETLLNGTLAARYYYIFAVDYTRGGEWAGRSLMCTKDTAFTIRGVEDCLARGFDRNGFIEVDTGEQKNWTIQLSDLGRPLTGAP